MKTKWFSGSTELKAGFALKNEIVRGKFNREVFQASIQRFDSFSLMVGTLDGKWNETEFLPVTRIIRFDESGSGHKCDARCQSAKGGQCECECGGKNHGINR